MNTEQDYFPVNNNNELLWIRSWVFFSTVECLFRLVARMKKMTMMGIIMRWWSMRIADMHCFSCVPPAPASLPPSLSWKWTFDTRNNNSDDLGWLIHFCTKFLSNCYKYKLFTVTLCESVEKIYFLLDKTLCALIISFPCYTFCHSVFMMIMAMMWCDRFKNLLINHCERMKKKHVDLSIQFTFSL